MKKFSCYKELLEHLEGTDKEMRTLGYAPDASPLVCVRSGGEKEPAIFVTAGSHSTEHAGVSAAVALVEELHTEHRVYIIPTRDPIGLNGMAHALSLGMGEKPEFDSFEEVEEILRRAGEVHFDEDEMLLALIGEYGYASSRPRSDRVCPQHAFYKKLQQLSREKPGVLEPFRGRRVFMAPGQPGIEASGNFGRAYTLIISLEGEVLHINRFHDTVWAPVEPRLTRKLMAEIHPGISFDLHESQLMQERFWLSARSQQDEENEAWERRIAHAVIQAIAASGATLAADRDVLGGTPIEQTWFRRGEQGVYWLDAHLRGEGLNLMDYASRVYGLAFGTEMAMYGSFEQRVRWGMITVQTGVAEFEQRYR